MISFNLLGRTTSLFYLASMLVYSANAQTIAPANKPDVVVQWNNAALQAVRDTKAGPPIVARALAVIHTCMYDAWSAYDERAKGTRLGTSLRRPVSERTDTNKVEAISYAAYRAVTDLFPTEDETVFRPLFSSLGYDPDNLNTDTTTPAGVGNVACNAVLEFRHHDESNQLGDLSAKSVPYSDYTGYQAVNPPSTVPVNPALIVDPNHWQPLQYIDPTGIAVTQGFLTPQWGRVIPFALRSGDELRKAVGAFGPATYGSSEYLQQAEELINFSAHLNDSQKMMAEYWKDGPRSETPPGHWCLFAQFVSARDHLTLDQDVKLFFALTNAELDASIVSWDAKRAFDSERPATAIPFLFHGQQIRAWAGPGKGTQWIDGKNWVPYQPGTFPTPAFPEYISGHSIFSAAAATVLFLFTGSDRFGGSATFAPGSSTIELGLTPSTAVTLEWHTFSEAANQAGLSRRLGGIHFKTGDLVARAAGRIVGLQTWNKTISLWSDRRSRPWAGAQSLTGIPMN